MTPTTNTYDGDADGADADGIRMSRQVLVVIVCKTTSAVVVHVL